jgi:cytochrome b involved in lipid metabolism
MGKDVTEKFKGATYKHSNAARNLAATLRIGRVQGYWQ